MAPSHDTSLGPESYLAALPRRLPASAAVDLLGVLADVKPAARVEAGALAPELVEWAALTGLAAATDPEGYVALARTHKVAAELLAIDRATGAHEYELGLMLGYPTCCSELIATIGEASIDARAATVARWSLDCAFRLIDIAGYKRGEALISHVPCHARCTPSLDLAAALRPTAERVSGTPGVRFRRFIARAQACVPSF